MSLIYFNDIFCLWHEISHGNVIDRFRYIHLLKWTFLRPYPSSNNHPTSSLILMCCHALRPALTRRVSASKCLINSNILLHEKHCWWPDVHVRLMDARAARLAHASLELPAWLPCGLPFCGTAWQQMVRVTTRVLDTEWLLYINLQQHACVV